jgi:lysozyme family protein
VADPKIAIALTIQNEGGFTDSPNDPGGATKYGITQRDLPNTNIADLTVEQATEYYLQNYWKPFYSQITQQIIANKLFDLGVLFGVATTVKMLQDSVGIDPDGCFGPDTLAKVNNTEATSLLIAFKTRLVSHALGIGAARPSERIFVGGWIRRINS